MGSHTAGCVREKKKMTLQQLKYFIEVANCGSINKAAERLFIAQPSLSNALRELETEIGLELLTRTPRGISLTTDGAEFLATPGRSWNKRVS